MNWRACNFANTYGWECADSFAEFMGADYDTNGDSMVDSEALAYVQGESEEDYVTRISQTLRSTIRDSNAHFVNSSTSFDYILSDDTHPTYIGSTVSVGLFGGTGSGSGAPDYPSNPTGMNPVWNQYGHERMGWAHFRLAEYDESLQAYRRAIEMDPGHWPSLNGVGVNALNKWLMSKKTDQQAAVEARNAFRRSLRVNPNQPKVASLLLKYNL